MNSEMIAPFPSARYYLSLFSIRIAFYKMDLIIRRKLYGLLIRASGTEKQTRLLPPQVTILSEAAVVVKAQTLKFVNVNH